MFTWFRTHFRLLTGIVSIGLLAWPTPTRGSRDPQTDGGAGRPICYSEEVWQARRIELGLDTTAIGTCGIGVCDDPVVRDGADTSPAVVPTVVHLMASGSGAFPDGVDEAGVDQQMADLNADFGPYGVQFDYETRVHYDPNYYCIPEFSLYSIDWLLAIRGMKATYAEAPDNKLNIFIGCQSGSDPSLGGIATFPWDPEALTVYGGTWINSEVVNAGYKVTTHEVGHCLGLWHTHHGYGPEIYCGDPCQEDPHPPDDPAADLVGDLCADTPATPANYLCVDPEGVGCNGDPWGETDNTNLMGYGSTCSDHFSDDQVRRMHCWMRSTLTGWIGGEDCTVPPNPPHNVTATPVTLSRINVAWDDISSNVFNYRVERDSGSGFEHVGTVPGTQSSYADTGLDCDADFSYRVIGSNCKGDSEYSETVSASTVCPPGVTLMHFESTEVEVGDGPGPKVFGDGTVTVLDQDGNPVAGALVYVQWDGTIFRKQTAVTDANGVAHFATELVHQSSYCFSMEAYGVILEGAIYYPNANVDTTGEAGNDCGS